MNEKKKDSYQIRVNKFCQKIKDNYSELFMLYSNIDEEIGMGDKLKKYMYHLFKTSAFFEIYVKELND